MSKEYEFISTKDDEIDEMDYEEVRNAVFGAGAYEYEIKEIYKKLRKKFKKHYKSQTPKTKKIKKMKKKLSELEDPVVWAHLAAQCASGREVIFASLRDLRASMRRAKRDEFDRVIYRTFVQDRQGELASRYIDEMGIEDGVFARFERRLASDDVLGALRV